MTVNTCDNYMAKLAEIETASQNALTTKAMLETLIDELAVLDAQVDTDLGSMLIPVTMTHLNKYVLVQIARSRKNDLQRYLHALVECRKAQLLADQKAKVGTEEERIAYGLETAVVNNYVEEVLEACPCMKNRREIMRIEVNRPSQANKNPNIL